jgi:hypothetical protein
MTDSTEMKNINKVSTSSNIITTIEYLLICVECHNQTGYVLLMTLNGSKVPLSTTQTSEIISNQSKEKFSRHLEH